MTILIPRHPHGIIDRSSKWFGTGVRTGFGMPGKKRVALAPLIQAGRSIETYRLGVDTVP